uniref:Protocadherin-like wing polarity protein stan n=1 Tax=Cacopsylla melanoneura TaxID=428564 RepID=A0A8D9E1Z6_9HEMI
MYYPCLWILFVSFIQRYDGYIVELTHHDPPGLVVFNTNVISDENNSNATRYYYINHDRSATFIRRIIHVDDVTGAVVLRHRLECNGLKYPNIFTLYIDSVSNATIDYMSVPLRIIIRKCSHHFDSDLVNEEYLEAKKWKSHTLVSYTIPTGSLELGTVPQDICLRQSQQVVSLHSSLIPSSITSECSVSYVDVSDYRFVIESSAGDLVASHDFCFSQVEPSWKINIHLSYVCVIGAEEIVSPSEHDIQVNIHLSYVCDRSRGDCVTF